MCALTQQQITAEIEQSPIDARIKPVLSRMLALDPLQRPTMSQITRDLTLLSRR